MVWCGLVVMLLPSGNKSLPCTLQIYNEHSVNLFHHSMLIYPIKIEKLNFQAWSLNIIHHHLEDSTVKSVGSCNISHIDPTTVSHSAMAMYFHFLYYFHDLNTCLHFISLIFLLSVEMFFVTLSCMSKRQKILTNLFVLIAKLLPFHQRKTFCILYFLQRAI